MPSAQENAENACDDGNEKCADKQIGGNRESTASLAHTAEIEDSDDDQNAHAQRNGVRQQRWNRRDQSTNSRRDADGGRENVIGEERGRSKQTGRCSEVEPRHGIGATARGIGGDGLAIGEVHDHQQGDNGRADGYDITNAEKAKRDQKAEGCFRAISSRAKRVETKDRNALYRADLLSALVAGFDGLADNQIKCVHAGRSPSTVCASKNEHLLTVWGAS